MNTLRGFKLTVTLFSIRSQLIGSVTHTGVRAQCVVAAMSTVGLRLTLIDICDKNMLEITLKKMDKHIWHALFHLRVSLSHM